MNVVLLLGLVSSGLVAGIEYYASTFDNVDIDTILSSERLCNQYINCILEKGPCTADARTFRHILPEAIATHCERCTQQQKQIARKVFVHLKENKLDEWIEFLERFDPEGEYYNHLEEILQTTQEEVEEEEGVDGEEEEEEEEKEEEEGKEEEEEEETNLSR